MLWWRTSWQSMATIYRVSIGYTWDVHLFIWQMFMKCQICARHGPRYPRHSNAGNRMTSLPLWSLHSGGRSPTASMWIVWLVRRCLWLQRSGVLGCHGWLCSGPPGEGDYWAATCSCRGQEGAVGTAEGRVVPEEGTFRPENGNVPRVWGNTKEVSVAQVGRARWWVVESGVRGHQKAGVCWPLSGGSFWFCFE